MSLLDFIKKKHAKSFCEEAIERIKPYPYSCFIDKPFYYIYSLDMMKTELKKNDLFISQVIHDNDFKITFVISRL